MTSGPGGTRMPPGTHGKIAIRTYTKNPELVEAYARYRLHTGQMRQIRRTGRSKAEATRRIKKAIATALGAGTAAKRGAAGISGRTAVRDLVADHMRRLPNERSVSPTTMVSYERAVKSVLREIGDLTVEEASPGELVAAFDRVQTKTPTQARIALTVIRGAFALAVRLDIIKINPALSVVPRPRKEKDPEALSDKQVELLLSLLSKDQIIHDGAVLMLATGIRIGELMALRVRDYRPTAKRGPSIAVTGRVLENLKGGARRASGTKANQEGDRVLVIALTREARRVIRRRVKGKRMDAPIFEARLRGGSVKPVLPLRPMTPGGFRIAWRRLIKGSELEGVSPHRLRATYATRVERGIDLVTAAKALGHSSAKVTAAHYVERELEIDTRRALEG